ncbi:Exosome complex component MTR3 [Taenia crassiceps]|uniref:Exosome complex component MTR3 n=1 Tax=Taenia crassiceps TaxID=6207 RepID=A0ABR4QMY8_9CEST
MLLIGVFVMDRFKAPSNAIDLCYFIKQHKVFLLFISLSFSRNLNSLAWFRQCNMVVQRSRAVSVALLKFAPFSSQVRRDSLKDAEEKRLSQLLLAALEPSVILDSFPREPNNYACNTSSCLSAGITCATLALVHAGVQMYDLAIGLEVISTALNPNSPNGDGPVSSVAVMPQLRQVTMFNGTSLALRSLDGLRRVIEEAFSIAESIYATIQSALYTIMKDEYESLEKSE